MLSRTLHLRNIKGYLNITKRCFIDKTNPKGSEVRYFGLLNMKRRYSIFSPLWRACKAIGPTAHFYQIIQTIHRTEKKWQLVHLPIINSKRTKTLKTLIKTQIKVLKTTQCCYYRYNFRQLWLCMCLLACYVRHLFPYAGLVVPFCSWWSQ